jgi:N-acetylglutamate synthase-like GNAT family acetyltransferase
MNILNTVVIAFAFTLGGLAVLAACARLARGGSRIWGSPTSATALTFVFVWLYCSTMFALFGPVRALGWGTFALFLVSFCVPSGAAILLWATDLRRQRFCIPKSVTRLPSCRVRPMSEADFDVCEQIYRLNEAGHLPAGGFERFSNYVRARHAEFVVVEVDGVVRGFGGIAVPKSGSVKIATLVFGVIHPDDHRKGYGTTLLLARLVSLARPTSFCTVVLYATDRSRTFYERFGFSLRSRAIDPVTGVELTGCHAQLWDKQWLECRALLLQSSVTLDFSPASVHVAHDSLMTSTVAAVLTRP